MIDNRLSALFIVCLIAAYLLGTGQAFAVGRTTPVEVMNTAMVGIDPNNSTVKAAQIDPWLVEVIGTPSFIISNSPTVKIDGTANTVKATQSGTWSVGISSMPTVNVNTHAVTQSGTWSVGISGTPTVSISGTGNTVQTTSKTSLVQLFSSDRVLENTGSAQSVTIDCSGYKEIRGSVRASVSSANLTMDVYFGTPVGPRTVGHFNFAQPTQSIGVGGNFVASTNRCVFTIPVMSDTFYLLIWNLTGGQVTINSESWVYLVN